MFDCPDNSNVEEGLDNEEARIYYKTKNRFSIDFLRNVLGDEITRLVKIQSNFVSMLDSIINDLKNKSLNGGSK